MHNVCISHKRILHKDLLGDPRHVSTFRDHCSALRIVTARLFRAYAPNILLLLPELGHVLYV